MFTVLMRDKKLVWTMLDQVLVSGSNYITTLFLLKIMGLEGFGEYTLALIFVLLALSIQKGIIISPLMTIGKQQTMTTPPLYLGAVIMHQFTFLLIIFLSAIITILVLSLINHSWSEHSIRWPLLCALLSTQCHEFMRGYFFAYAQPQYSFFIDFLRYATQTLVLIILIFFEDKLISVEWVLITISFTSFIAFLISIQWLASVKIAYSPLPLVTKRHWSFSKWILGTTLLNGLKVHFMISVIAIYIGVAEAGAVRIVQQIVLLSNLMIQGLANIVPVRAAAAYSQNGFEGLMNYIKTAMLPWMILMFLYFILLFLYGTEILLFLYDEEISQYGDLLSGYALIHMLFVTSYLYGIILRASEQTKYEFYPLLYSSITIFSLTIPMVKLFEIQGLLIMGVLSQSITLLLVIYYLRHALNTQQIRIMH